MNEGEGLFLPPRKEGEKGMHGACAAEFCLALITTGRRTRVRKVGVNDEVGVVV